MLQFKENEEKFEKKVQEQLGNAADAVTSTASDAVGKVKEVLPNVKGKDLLSFLLLTCSQL